MKVCPRCDFTFGQETWPCPNCRYEPEWVNGIPCFAPNDGDPAEGFDTKMFTKLYALEANHFWFRVRSRIILWALKKYLPQNGAFLEIGCGTGIVMKTIESECPGLSTAGSEFQMKGLELAAERLSRSRLWQMDARRIPFASEFDVIGAFDVLEHIKEDKVVLQQMHRALRQGGGIILTVPQHKFLWSAADEHAHHERRYTTRELKEKVEEAGFEIVRKTSFMTFLFPIMFISRKLSPANDTEQDPMKELQIGSLINRLFQFVMHIEAFLIRLGISLPFGGSLLLVAIKKSS